MPNLDEVAFETVSEKNPAVIETIRAAFEAGLTAEHIEARLFAKFGTDNIVVTMIAGAAHYMQRQRLEAAAAEG